MNKICLYRVAETKSQSHLYTKKKHKMKIKLTGLNS